MVENDAALGAGIIEPMLPTDAECAGVVESDVKDITAHIVHDASTYLNAHLPAVPSSFRTSSSSSSTSSSAIGNDATSGQQLLPVDSEELKMILRRMSSSDPKETTSSGWQFQHVGKIHDASNGDQQQRIVLTAAQLQELSAQYEQATGKRSAFYEQLKQQMNDNNGTSQPSSSSLSTTTAVNENVVTRTDSVNGDQVAVVDLKQLDWWTFVNDKEAQPNNSSSSVVKPSSTPSSSCATSTTQPEVDDEWQLVDNEEFVSALSDFIAQTMKNNPDVASKLPPDQLRKMLTDVFIQVKSPNTSSRLWQWGSFAYHTYSWGTTIMQLYNNKLVAQGLYAAASWVLVLLL